MSSFYVDKSGIGTVITPGTTVSRVQIIKQDCVIFVSRRQANNNVCFSTFLDAHT